MTFLSPLLFTAMAVLVGYLANLNNDEVTKVAIHDEAGLLEPNFKDSEDMHYVNLSQLPLADAKEKGQYAHLNKCNERD